MPIYDTWFYTICIIITLLGLYGNELLMNRYKKYGELNVIIVFLIFTGIKCEKEQTEGPNPLVGHSNQLAYDFVMNIDDTIYSIGAGVDKDLREDQPDNGGDIEASNHNFIMIQHNDGSVAFYAQLMQNGVLVEKNEYVQQGM
jgi:hypothetical protein